MEIIPEMGLCVNMLQGSGLFIKVVDTYNKVAVWAVMVVPVKGIIPVKDILPVKA